MVPMAMSTVMTAVPMTRIHGIVPVKKKSKTLPPESENDLPRH